MILVTPDVIKACVPGISKEDLDKYAFPTQTVWTHFEMDANPYRVAASLAQVAIECGNFRKMEENMNYSAKRLMEVFPKYFKTLEEAKKYANRPYNIASRVYANRMGNGPEESGDGWKYRGKGAIQITGRINQNKCAAAGKFSVEDFTNPYPAMFCAGWFWDENNLNRFCDSGQMADFDKLSKAINLGNPNALGTPHGNDDRRDAYVTALKGLKKLGYLV